MKNEYKGLKIGENKEKSEIRVESTQYYVTPRMAVEKYEKNWNPEVELIREKGRAVVDHGHENGNGNGHRNRNRNVHMHVNREREIERANQETRLLFSSLLELVIMTVGADHRFNREIYLSICEKLRMRGLLNEEHKDMTAAVREHYKGKIIQMFQEAVRETEINMRMKTIPKRVGCSAQDDIGDEMSNSSDSDEDSNGNTNTNSNSNTNTNTNTNANSNNNNSGNESDSYGYGYGYSNGYSNDEFSESRGIYKDDLKDVENRDKVGDGDGDRDRNRDIYMEEGNSSERGDCSEYRGQRQDQGHAIIRRHRSKTNSDQSSMLARSWMNSGAQHRVMGSRQREYSFMAQLMDNFKKSRYREDFVEVRRIGKGGFGEVYETINKLDGLRYAIKQIRIKGQVAAEKTLREIKVLARLNHPNIVRYYSSWIEFRTKNKNIEGSGGNNNSRASRRPKPKIKLESVVHEDEHEHEERGRRRGLETNSIFNTISTSSAGIGTGVGAGVGVGGMYSDLNYTPSLGQQRQRQRQRQRQNYEEEEEGEEQGEGEEEGEGEGEEEEMSADWSDGVVFADDSLSKSGQVYFEESSENPISTKGTKTLISSNTSCTNSNSNSNSNSNHNNKNRPIPFSTLQIPKPIPINTTNTPFTRHGISSPSSKNYHHYSSSQPLNIVYPKSLPSENHLLTNNPSLSISMSRSFAKTYLVDIPKPSIPLPKERPVLFVQMQLCESTLHEYLLHRNKSLDFPIDNSVNLALFKDICLGVEAIHKANLIHRDLKPANVFLNLIGDPCSFCSASPYPPLFSSYSASCPNNCSKILPLIGDFGLVSTSDISPDDPLSLSLSLSPSPSTPIPPPNSHSHRSRCLSESIIPPDFSPKPLHHPLTPPSFASPRTSGIGTVTYAAPEQLADPSSSSSYGYKADIYSLGIIFFELFYKFNTLMERHLVLKNLRSAIFPADFESTWPAHAEFVRWLMNKSPSLRPSASEILSSPLFASLSSPSSSSSSTTTTNTTTTTTKSTTNNTKNTNININTNASSCSDSHNSSSTISSSLLNDPCPDLSELQLQLDQKNKHISFLNNKISLLEKLLSNK